MATRGAFHVDDRALLDQQVRDAVKAVEDACVNFRVVHNRRAAFDAAQLRDMRSGAV